MSRTYRRCIWDKRTAAPHDDRLFYVRVPDNFHFRFHNDRYKIGNSRKFDWDSGNLANNRIRSHIFADEDLRMAEF